MALIRVRDKSTGHEYTIHDHLFNDEAHTKTDKSPTGHDGEVAPPKFRTTVDRAAAEKSAKLAASTGHRADPKKES